MWWRFLKHWLQGSDNKGLFSGCKKLLTRSCRVTIGFHVLLQAVLFCSQGPEADALSHFPPKGIGHHAPTFTLYFCLFCIWASHVTRSPRETAESLFAADWSSHLGRLYLQNIWWWGGSDCQPLRLQILSSLLTVHHCLPVFIDFLFWFWLPALHSPNSSLLSVCFFFFTLHYWLSRSLSVSLEVQMSHCGEWTESTKPSFHTFRQKGLLKKI